MVSIASGRPPRRPGDRPSRRPRRRRRSAHPSASRLRCSGGRRPGCVTPYAVSFKPAHTSVGFAGPAGRDQQACILRPWPVSPFSRLWPARRRPWSVARAPTPPSCCSRSPLEHDDPRRRAGHTGHPCGGVAPPGQHRAGERCPRSSTRHAPGNAIRPAALAPLAAARPCSLRTRRTVARDCAPRAGPCGMASKRTTRAPSGWPTSSWHAVTSSSATRRRCRSISARPPRHSTLSAIDATWPWCTRSPAARSRRRDATTKHSRRCARPNASRLPCTPTMSSPSSCGNQANVAMMRHRYDQALALAERSVALHEQFPPGHGLAVALATLGQICIHLGALPRAEAVLQRALEVRSAAALPRDDGRDLRLAGADSPASRDLRPRRRVSAQRPRCLWRLWRADTAAGMAGRCGCSRRVSRSDEDWSTRSPRGRRNRRGAGRAPRGDAARAPDRRRSAPVCRAARRGREAGGP